MKNLLLILISIATAASVAYGQSFTSDDLVALSSYTPKYAEQYLIKKGFLPNSGQVDYNSKMTSFTQNSIASTGDHNGNDSLVSRSIDIYTKDGIKYFAWHTSSAKEFTEGKLQLIRAGFFYDHSVQPQQDTSLLFQKRNITVETIHEMTDIGSTYSFILTRKEYPDPRSIQYAEDLLKFTSNEYLVGFFGAANVKQDLYYFSKDDLRKCTVIFPNSSKQAVFVWEDQRNLRSLSYIIISDIMPTVNGEQYKGVLLGNNQWELRNGIHCGMTVRELLQLNSDDFEIYGKRSEFAYMIKPEKKGNLDFRKAGITLNCLNCEQNKLFDVSIVNAQDIAEGDLLVNVGYINVFPEKQKERN
jgi:hypothetical protein